MYTAALLGAVYCLTVGRPLAGMVAYGLACSLKPQAIFLAPFLGGWVFRESKRWRWLGVPPLVYAVCGLPAMLAGRPVWEVLFHWGRQQNSPVLTLGAPNWYQWVSNGHYAVFWQAGVVLTMVATAFLVLAMQATALSRMEPGLLGQMEPLVGRQRAPFFFPRSGGFRAAAVPRFRGASRSASWSQGGEQGSANGHDYGRERRRSFQS
jgi:hypothetical protein